MNSSGYSPWLRIPAMITLVATVGCASSTMIQSNPPGARIFVDGAPVGVTPYQMTDTKIVGSVTAIRLEMPGYETANVMISRNEEFDVGACIGGVLVLVPFLWIMGYRPVHMFELRPAGAQPGYGYPPGAGYPPAQPAYGQPAYQQPAQPGYAQPGYPPPPPAQPGYGQPAAPPPAQPALR